MKTEHPVNGASPVSLRDRLMAHIVLPVPDGIALCEFNCSATECSQEAWTHCKRRLEALAEAHAPEET
jgi:hypothetical protein